MGKSLLLGRQGDRADVCASLRGADAQFAPAGADLEHSAAVPDARGVEKPVDLAPLGVGEACLAGRKAAEQRTGVRHGVVEELGEQVVGQVVVLGDVAPRLPAAVVVRTRLANHGEGPKALQDRRNQFGEPLGELGEQTREIVGAPVAGHVRLAEADEPVAPHPADHRVGPVHEHRRQCRVGGADDVPSG